MDWLFVKGHVEDDFAYFRHLENVENDYDLDSCISMLESFPADAQVRMDPDFPDEIALADSLGSNGKLLIVNGRVRELFESQGVKDVEWLPVAVINHKGKVVKEKYYVINLLRAVDCIDLEQGTIEWNDINPDMIATVKGLVIDETRIPSGLKFFRPARMQYAMMIHRSLAEAIEAEALTGFLFTEVSAYRS